MSELLREPETLFESEGVKDVDRVLLTERVPLRVSVPEIEMLPLFDLVNVAVADKLLVTELEGETDGEDVELQDFESVDDGEGTSAFD